MMGHILEHRDIQSHSLELIVQQKDVANNAGTFRKKGRVLAL